MFRTPNVVKFRRGYEPLTILGSGTAVVCAFSSQVASEFSKHAAKRQATTGDETGSNLFDQPPALWPEGARRFVDGRVLTMPARGEPSQRNRRSYCRS